MYLCAVPGCHEISSRKMHRFPKPETYRKLFLIWLERIGNKKLANLDYGNVHRCYRICHKHFDPFCYAPNWKFLKKGSLPTLQLPSFSGDSRTNCNIRFLESSSDSNNFTTLKNVANLTTQIPNTDKEAQSSTSINSNDKNEDYRNSEANNVFTHDYVQSILGNATDLVPQIPDTLKGTQSGIRINSNDKNEDCRTYEANDLFTITEDYIEAIIKVPQENANTSLPEERLLQPETDTPKELSAKFALLHQNYNDYIQKTEKELKQMDLILEFLTDNKCDGIYNCPKCRYVCGAVNEIKIHLIAHTERRLCDICFKIFNSEVETASHSRLHNVKILDHTTDHQYSIKIS